MIMCCNEERNEISGSLAYFLGAMKNYPSYRGIRCDVVATFSSVLVCPRYSQQNLYTCEANICISYENIYTHGIGHT